MDRPSIRLMIPLALTTLLTLLVSAVLWDMHGPPELRRAAWWSPAQAGELPRPARIGVVHLSHQPEAPVVIGLRQGLAELGYVEERDVILEIRAGEGQYQRALEAARELAQAQVQLFVSAGTVATKAVQEAAGPLPIVFTQVGDPLAAGFVQSIPRPGGNLTGLSHMLVDTTGKRLQLLRELVPSVRTVLICACKSATCTAVMKC